MRTVAEEYDRVVGVDTHAATHTMTLLIAATGAMVEQRTFPTSAAGLRRALTWIGNRTQDRTCLVVVEGTGSYGARLTEHFTQSGIIVAEDGRLRVRDRNTLRYYARSLDHLLESPSRHTH